MSLEEAQGANPAMEAMVPLAAAMEPQVNAETSAKDDKKEEPAASQGPEPGVKDEKDLNKVIEEAQGQILIIMIGSPTCVPCHKTIPILNGLADQNDNVTVIVVEVGGTKEEAEKISEKNPDIIVVPVAGDDPPKIFPPVTGYPMIVTPDGKGGYVVIAVGMPNPKTVEEWEKVIKKHQEEMKKKQEEEQAKSQGDSPK
ncbi:MAG: hypothetical protein HYZ90_05605 [Candidatus Omnitrophica bacterium]|nr:hypothetical protein [Candidatus Omnitrophota bacterium]